jgi:hypothetical protein
MRGRRVGAGGGVNALKEWSPIRYGSHDVARGGTIIGDALSYDIFSAAAHGDSRKANRDVMGGLKVQRLIATVTRSRRTPLQLFPLGASVDVEAVRRGVAARGGGRVSQDLNVKVFKFLDESDVIGQANARIPDSSGYRSGRSRAHPISTRSSHARWRRSSARLGMRPVESSAPIGGPSISGGEKGNGAGGNGSGLENEGVNGGCSQPPSVACRRITC